VQFFLIGTIYSLKKLDYLYAILLNFNLNLNVEMVKFYLLDTQYLY